MRTARMRIVFPLFCLAVAALWSAPLARAQEKSAPLVSYYGKPPVLDGVLSPGEWDDASQFTGVKDWWPAFHPVTDDQDSSLKGFVKHDGKHLYFAADVTDDLLYGIDTPRYLPPSNPKAHELTREGYPWLGDEMEILLFAGESPLRLDAEGNGTSWQMVCNLTKSRAGGVGAGGILEGEPRSRAAAWETYRKWIEDGAQQCAARPKPGGKGYVIEWAIRFDPCVETSPGVFYSPELGPATVRIKVVLGDMDRPEDGAANPYLFHHEQWFAPGASPDGRRAWGYLRIMGIQKRP